MRPLNLFRKSEQKGKPGRFSDFFLHAPERKKEMKSYLKTKTS